MFWMQQDPTARRRALPRHISVRRGTMDDEHATFEVMRKTMGHEMAWTHHAPARNHLQTAPGASFWIAEERLRFAGSRVVGYARSVVRDGVWSLTEFFVLPGHHRQGIGGALLNHCMEDGDALGADTRLVLASQHSGADSLYVRRLGCCPRLPMMMLVGKLSALKPPDTVETMIADPMLPYSRASLAGQPPRQETTILRAEPFVLSHAVSEAIDTLDRSIVGYARPEEHAFWSREMGGPAGPSRLFRRSRRAEESGDDMGGGDMDGGEIVGYAYIGAHSSGPALAARPEDLPHLLAHVARLSVATSAAESEFESVQPLEQYWAMAGTNEITLRWLLECGWQIVFHYLFMSTRPLGSLDRYVGYNPLYFL